MTDPSSQDGDPDRTLIRAPAPPQGNSLPPGTRLEEFEILSVLGEGGFGIVYLAQDQSLGRRVALKEFMPTSLAARTGATQVVVKSERHRETYDLALNSFVNEARLLAQFDHPSLLKVHRFWSANGTAYMVMPFYEGKTLRDHLRSLSSPPDEAWLLSLLSPLLDAIEVLHDQNCYHRDIAPDNILLLAGSELPLLLDFGAARRVISDHTQALTVILKPGYAPIEQYAEIPNLKQGPWTDIYALAAVVRFAISGAPPKASVARMVKDEVKPLSDLMAGRYSSAFLGAIDRALSVHPDARPQNVDEFRRELGLSGGASPVSMPVTQQLPPVIRPDLPTEILVRPPDQKAEVVEPRKGLHWSIVGGGAVLLIVGGLYALMRPGGELAPVSKQAPVVQASASAAAPPPVVVSAAASDATALPPAAPADPVDQVMSGRTQGFDVKIRTERPRLRIGDRLGFSVESVRDGYVQIVAEDPAGVRTLLFPNSRSKQNLIRAGQIMKLPHASWPLVASPPAGQVRLVVVVSAAPRGFTVAGGRQEDVFTVLPARGAESSALAPGWLAGSTDCSDNGCRDYGADVLSIQVVN